MDDRKQNAIAQSNLVNGCSKQRGDRQSERPSDKILQWFAIFHPWDFIVAVATKGKPDWTTNSKFPLNAKTLYARWVNPEELIGVRFSTSKGGQTQYAMLDVDIGSQYHPFINEQAFHDVLAVLETIGLCRWIIIQSSDSGGLHVYFPLPKPIVCYKLALAIQQALQQADIVVKPGQLEMFPNVRSSNRSRYAAHRLPLQIGSCVLDGELQFIHNQLDRLIDTWWQVASQQDSAQLEQAINAAKSFRTPSSNDATEWRQRLEDTLEYGWTGSQQTNQITKEACIYARVFQRLEWDDVERWVLAKIVTLPGYQQFCGHRREIRRRVKDWVKANRQSDRYHPYGSQTKPPKELKAPPNDVRSQEAFQRIKAAIAAIEANFGDLPSGVKKRQRLICKMAQCSAATLRKYLELWHPDFQKQACVTPDAVKVSSTLDHRFELPKGKEKPLGCVTRDAVKVSTLSESSADRGTIAEKQARKVVTDPPLLSVFSFSQPDSSGEGALSTDLPELELESATATSTQTTKSSQHHQRQQLSLKTQQQPTFKPEAKNKAASISSIRSNDIVQRKTDKALFRVQRVNNNGTLWGRWLNQFVPLVDVVLHVSEIELLKQCA